MYLTERRRKELDDPKAHVVTAGDLQYLLTKAILEHEDKEIHLDESIPDLVQRFLGKRKDQLRAEQLTVFFGSLVIAKREYERRRHWEQSREKVFIIDWLNDYLDHFYSEFFGIKYESDMQRNGDLYKRTDP